MIDGSIPSTSANGRSSDINELADGKTSGCRERPNVQGQIIVVVDYIKTTICYPQTVTFSECFYTAPANSPKPPWLSPMVRKTVGRTHGGAGKENENDSTESMRQTLPEA